MASEKLFENIAPFPDEAPTVPLYTIPLAGLRSSDGTVARNTLTACRELGFFLLDLREDELGDSLVKEIDQIFGLGKDLLNLPHDVKEQYLNDAPKSLLGRVETSQA